MTKIPDASEPSYSLSMDTTEDAEVVEVNASNGLYSITLDIRLDDLQAALDEQRLLSRDRDV